MLRWHTFFCVEYSTDIHITCVHRALKFLRSKKLKLVIYIWAIPRKVTYTLHKKSQVIGQPIEEGE